MPCEREGERESMRGDGEEGISGDFPNFPVETPMGEKGRGGMAAVWEPVKKKGAFLSLPPPSNYLLKGGQEGHYVDECLP